MLLHIIVEVEGAGLVPWSRECFVWVLLKRSIPNPDKHRKGIIQQELLALICYRT